MKMSMKIVLAIAILICCNVNLALGQEMPPIPVDPDVRIGKLENGLTYYIRRNNLPEDRVDYKLEVSMITPE